MCISIEILGRFSEDVYVKGDKYILVKTKHPGRIDRRQKKNFGLDTVNKFGCQRNEFEQ